MATRRKARKARKARPATRLVRAYERQIANARCAVERAQADERAAREELARLRQAVVDQRRANIQFVIRELDRLELLLGSKGLSGAQLALHARRAMLRHRLTRLDAWSIEPLSGPAASS